MHNYYSHYGLGEAPVMPPQAPAPFYEEPAAYVFEQTLTANQSLSNLSQAIEIDSDFVWVSLHGTATGAYRIRIRNTNGRYLSSGFLNSANAVGTAQFPVPVFPSLVYPAGGRIALDLTDTSGSSNTIQLVFGGLRRYRTR